MLVTREMVEQMRPGSVVVDLAAESGGNVEGSVAGEIVAIGHAQVWGGRNVPAQMPGPASRLYAQNVVNLVTLMTADGEEVEPGTFAPDLEDEIVAAVLRDPRRRDPARTDTHRDRGPGPRPADSVEGDRAVNDAVTWLTFFVLSVFVGIEVISKVSSTLHTPLMSGANAIHGIILLGAMLVTGETDNGIALTVGLIAIVLAAVNMVGGFVVTDRMLQMFIRKKPKAAAIATDGRAA